jgi:hypothetical protein
MGELIEKTERFPRGMAHPVAFLATQDLPGELKGRKPGIVAMPDFLNSNFEQFGAVMVTPRNYYRLMQSGQDALLFPGGAKEALSSRKDYPLFWPEDKTDFIRTAARFNATIVPVSAVGMLDSVEVLVEPQEVFNVPFIGAWAKNFNQNISAARYDQKGNEEILGIPLALPKLPARNYFIFGKPVDLSELDPKDKDGCQDAYRQVQMEVRNGLDDLLEARKHDPYSDTPKRLVYERIFGKTAPTFQVDEINYR